MIAAADQLTLAARNETLQIPPSWRWATLGEVCDFLDFRRVPVNEAERSKRIAGKPQSDLYPYYGANGQVGWIDDFIFDEPLILLAEDGGFFGSFEKPVAYAIAGRTWVNNHAHVLRPKPAKIDFDFCHLSLRIRPDIGRLVAGSTRAKLNQATASIIPIPLPPLSEQRRIAARLREQLAEVKKARTAVQAQLDAAALLPAAELRAVFASPAAGRWRRQELCAVATTCSGTTPPRGTDDYYGGSVPWVKTGELVDGVINDTSEHITEKALAETSLRLLPVGTVLIAMYGQGQTRGRTGLLACEATTNQACFAILPNENFEPAFLQLWFQHSYQRLRAMTEGRGGNQPNLNGDVLRRELVPVPERDQQRQIAAALANRLGHTAALSTVLRDRLSALDTLPAALLREAFAGGI